MPIYSCVDSQPNEYNNTTNGIYLTLSAIITTFPWCETKGEICVNKTNAYHNVKQKNGYAKGNNCTFVMFMWFAFTWWNHNLHHP